MDWRTTANGLIALIPGLVGLIGTGIGTFFAVKAWIKNFKDKSAKEIWAAITAAADAAIQEVEFRAKSGEILNKRETAIAIVQASCAASGLDISTFTDQLVKYIDDCVGFVNGFNKAAADGEKLAKKK